RARTDHVQHRRRRYRAAALSDRRRFARDRQGGVQSQRAGARAVRCRPDHRRDLGAADDGARGCAHTAQRTPRRHPGDRAEAEICPGGGRDGSSRPVPRPMRSPMLRPTKSLLLVHAVVAGLLAASALSPASAQQNERSRGVKIIDAPTPAPGAPTPAPGAPTPAPGAATPAPPSAPGAAVLTPPPGLTSLPSLNAPTKEAAIPTTPAPLGKLPPGIKVANAAELAVEILPGAEIPTGTKVFFRVSTKKEGYLLLVDVDATGKVTQIYPNPMSLLNASGGRQNSNRIKPGKPIVIPNPTDPYAGFEFVASPPE